MSELIHKVSELNNAFTEFNFTFTEMFNDIVEEIRTVNERKEDLGKVTTERFATERRDAIRYEKVRKLSVLQFSEVFESCMKHNIRFDDAIDELPEPWRYSDRYYSDISNGNAV
tara:strand:+ start:1068 stop:1409 length:342 start_codon:yes stop_codon:yes gene_type:complete